MIMSRARIEIQFVVYIITLWLILYGQVNSLDCRRHVFAPGCRGIVAKRTNHPNNSKFDITSSKMQEDLSTSGEDLSESTGNDGLILKRFTVPLIVLLHGKTPESSNNNNNANSNTKSTDSLTTWVIQLLGLDDFKENLLKPINSFGTNNGNKAGSGYD